MSKLKSKFKKVDNAEVNEEPKFNNLEEVMDYKRPTTIMYSGVENPSYLDILYDLGVRHFLMSYEYVKSKGNAQLKRHPDMHLFIDSGAFTYMADPKYEEYTVEQWESQIEKYLAWAERHKDQIFAICDLDLQYLVGYEKVYEWRRKYFEPFMLRTGIPVCFMYHDDGIDQWEKMCQRYPYVGMSLAIDKQDGGTATLEEMFRVAEKHNALVQGMASTNTAMMSKYPFYTVDSSVDGNSSIVVKNNDTGLIERLTIAELYSKVSEMEKRTTPTELRVPTDSLDLEVLTVDDVNKTVWGKLNAVVKHEVAKETRKFKVDGGTELITTSDHSIITMNKEGELIETKADELKVGDFVLSPKHYSLGTEEQDFIEVLIQKPNFSKESLEVNMVEISDELLNFLGLWIGDGCYFTDDPTSIGFSCYQDVECKDIIDKVCSVFKANPKVQPNGIDVRINSARLRRVMEQLQFRGTSHTKRIPEIIYSLSERQVGEFLKGYFSADGTHTCECSTVSIELKNDLVELLNMMGISTSVSFKDRGTFIKDGKEYNSSPIWHLTIRPINHKIKFREKIGFLQDYKLSKLDDVITSTTPRVPKREMLPKSLAISDKVYYPNGRTSLIAKSKGNKITRQNAEGVFNDKVIDSELNFLEIKEITIVNDGSKEVEIYDLSVEKYERFIANGILVHNTTWLAGLKYGEISVWNGTKMSRIKKTEFETKAFPVIENYPMEFDLDAIRDEDVTEMIKVNAYAFILAEEVVRERLKAKMYWLKAKAVKQDVNNLSSDFFPSPEWLENPNLDEVRGYAEQMNINQEHETVTDLVIQATLFMNWYNPNYTNIRDLHFDNEEIINNFHDFYVNKIRSTTEEKIADLIEFYKECIAGESDTLLHLGTNFDRVVREREEYIEEEEYDLEDVDEEEIRGRLANLLPTPEDGDPAPEISSLDDEIFSNVDIVPIRDERGRLVKGQKKVKRPKQVYSKKFPKLACDTCHASAKCPEYKAGYVCAFHRMFNRFSTRDMGDIIESMQGIVEHNMTRMQKAMIMETMNGTIDPVVSQLMDTNLKYMQMLQQMYEHGSPEVLKKTTTIRADGTREEVTSYTNPQGGGILEKLFAQPNNAKEEDKSINDLVDDEPKKEEKRDTTKEINADYIEVTIDKD